MKTFHYTIPNTDPWGLASTEIIIVAEDKKIAKTLLKTSGYIGVKAKDLTELKSGVHLVQHSITE
jgi:hypothetical protein